MKRVLVFLVCVIVLSAAWAGTGVADKGVRAVQAAKDVSVMDQRTLDTELKSAVCSQGPEATRDIRRLVEKGADLYGQDFDTGPFAMILRRPVLSPAVFTPYADEDSASDDFASEDEGVERLRFVLGLIQNQEVKESCVRQVLMYAAKRAMLGVMERLLTDYPYLARECLEAARVETSPRSLLTVRYLLPRLMSSSMSYLIVPSQSLVQPLGIEAVEGRVAEQKGSLYELRPGVYQMRGNVSIQRPDIKWTGEASTSVFEAKPGCIYMARAVQLYVAEDSDFLVDSEVRATEQWRLVAWVVYAPGESLAFPNPTILGHEYKGEETDRYRLPLPESKIPEVRTPTRASDYPQRVFSARLMKPRRLSDPWEAPILEEERLVLEVVVPYCEKWRSWIDLFDGGSRQRSEYEEVSCAGKGTVTVLRWPVVLYSDGVVVLIKATADPGYRFRRWTGADVLSPRAATTAVSLPCDYSIVAEFVPASKK